MSSTEAECRMRWAVEAIVYYASLRPEDWDSIWEWSGQFQRYSYRWYDARIREEEN